MSGSSVQAYCTIVVFPEPLRPYTEMKGITCPYLYPKRNLASCLILAELGLNVAKGSEGFAVSFSKIEKAIKSRLEKNTKKLFVIILDEFDIIFEDRRGRPSDFVYKLIEKIKELAKLKDQGILSDIEFQTKKSELLARL